MPTGIPNLEYSEEGNYSMQTAQLWYSMGVVQLKSVIAQLWNSMAKEQHHWQAALEWGRPGARALQLDSSTPVRLHLLQSASFFSGETSSVFQFQPEKCRENVPLTLQWKGKCILWDRGELTLYKQKSPPLVPDWSVLMQMRTPSPCSMTWPKNTVLIGQNGAALIRQWRCWWGWGRGGI